MNAICVKNFTMTIPSNMNIKSIINQNSDNYKIVFCEIINKKIMNIMFVQNECDYEIKWTNCYFLQEGIKAESYLIINTILIFMIMITIICYNK